MRALVLLLAISGCGPSVKSRPASDVIKPLGPQYCVVVTVKYSGKIHNVYACTPNKAMCDKGVKDAKGTPGKLVGVRSVTDCKLVKH